MAATRGTIRVVQEWTAAALAVGLALGGGTMWVCGAPFAEALVPVGLAWWVAVCAIPARRPGTLARLTKNVVSFRRWPGRRARRKEQTMALTKAQAKDLRESCADVFTPEGDAGVIERVRTFTTLDGTVTKAQVFGRLVHGQWYPLADLDSAETLRG